MGGAVKVVAITTLTAGLLHVWRAGSAESAPETYLFAAVGALQILLGVVATQRLDRSATAAALFDALCIGAYVAVHAPSLMGGTPDFELLGVAVVGLQALGVVAWLLGTRDRSFAVATLGSRRPDPLAIGTGPSDAERRRLMVAGSVGAASLIAGGVVGRLAAATTLHRHDAVAAGEPLSGKAAHEHGNMTVGEVDHRRNGFDPTTMLNDWDLGDVSVLPNGRTQRSYVIVAQDSTIEVAPGVFFEAWNYNGRVPGPTIRCREGDRIRVEFINGGSHPHTIHFHGIHSATMDGIPGVGAGNIMPGDRTVYEFDAFPFGAHLYHCHTSPLKRHIHKGLYGAFIIDPDPARHPGQADIADRRTVEGARAAGIREFVMVMNGFDTNLDGENEIYAVNTVAFHYAKHPIRIGTGDRIRLYLANLTEFDPINSLHLHANFFDYYDHGTTLEPTLRTIDTIMQCQAQRGILEFDYRRHAPGSYMFHAHQSEFVELGWMSFFEVVEGRTT
jgi:manganese oxidase